jgi:hypothetical protein
MQHGARVRRSRPRLQTCATFEPLYPSPSHVAMVAPFGLGHCDRFRRGDASHGQQTQARATPPPSWCAPYVPRSSPPRTTGLRTWSRACAQRGTSLRRTPRSSGPARARLRTQSRTSGKPVASLDSQRSRSVRASQRLRSQRASSRERDAVLGEQPLVGLPATFDAFRAGSKLAATTPKPETPAATSPRTNLKPCRADS